MIGIIIAIIIIIHLIIRWRIKKYDEHIDKMLDNIDEQIKYEKKMEEELNLLMKKGYWFSLIPKDKKIWHATIWKKNPSNNWDGIAWKQTKSLKQGMKFIEKYLSEKLWEESKED